jgi:hypothetical protein
MTRLTIDGALALSRNGQDAGRIVPHVDASGLRTWRWERPGEDRARRYLRIDHALLDAEAAEPSTPPDSDAALFAFGVWCLIAGQGPGATILRPLAPQIAGYPPCYGLPRAWHCALVALRADGTCAGISWNVGNRIPNPPEKPAAGLFKTRVGTFQESKAIHSTRTLAAAVPRLVHAAMSPQTAHDRLAAAHLVRQVQAWLQAPGAPATAS